MKKSLWVLLGVVPLFLVWGCSLKTQPTSGGQVQAMTAPPSGSTWQLLPNYPVTVHANEPSLFVYNGTPYVAYQDGSNSNKLSVMSYNGSYWSLVGAPDFTPGAANNPSLFVYGGKPYVAFQDAANSNKGAVMTYTGTSWAYVGGGDFSPAQADSPSLSIFKGRLYVAFVDYSIGQKATVMVSSGGAWSYLSGANAGISPGIAADTTLAMNLGTPYVAFQDIPNGTKATVMTFNGAGWVNVGNPDFSQTTAANLVLSVSSGIPYVAFMDPSCNGESAMSYTGGSWGYVGNQCGASVPAVPSLFVYNGTPYLAFTDGLQYVTVNTYQGGWGPVGTADFGGPAVQGPSLFVYNGTPYVAFSNSAVGNALMVMAYM